MSHSGPEQSNESQIGIGNTSDNGDGIIYLINALQNPLVNESEYESELLFESSESSNPTMTFSIIDSSKRRTCFEPDMQRLDSNITRVTKAEVEQFNQEQRQLNRKRNCNLF